MGAALAGHERVNFIDDDRVDRCEPFARVRRQQQEQRFRRRDQDVGGFASEPGALDGRRIARANRDLGNIHAGSRGARHVGDADERRPQVPFDVDRQRLERRDIKDTASLLGWRRGPEHQTVQAPEKRRERLATAGRRQDQRRFATGNRRPAKLLRPGRRVKRVSEPLTDRRVEEVQDLAARHTTI